MAEAVLVLLDLWKQCRQRRRKGRREEEAGKRERKSKEKEGREEKSLGSCAQLLLQGRKKCLRVGKNRCCCRKKEGKKERERGSRKERKRERKKETQPDQPTNEPSDHWFFEKERKAQISLEMGFLRHLEKGRKRKGKIGF